MRYAAFENVLACVVELAGWLNDGGQWAWSLQEVGTDILDDGRAERLELDSPRLSK